MKVSDNKADSVLIAKYVIEKRIEIIHATGPSIVLTETENTHRGGRHIFYNDIFVNGSIYATGVIIDDQGNTNHHGH